MFGVRLDNVSWNNGDMKEEEIEAVFSRSSHRVHSSSDSRHSGQYHVSSPTPEHPPHFTTEDSFEQEQQNLPVICS